LENRNLQLSWVGQGMPESYLFHLAQSQLKKSRYGKDIDALQISNTASGVSFRSLHDFFLGLERLDRLCGLPYGGAAVTKSTPKLFKKPPVSNVGMVSSVQDSDGVTSVPLELHSKAWIGAINLNEDHVKVLRSLFKCPQCRTNNHTFPSCPLLKNWVIKKRVRPDPPLDSSTSGAVRSAITSPIESVQERLASTNLDGGLTSIPEASHEHDFDSEVEFDILSGDTSDN
jgi:hypothetical protein